MSEPPPLPPSRAGNPPPLPPPLPARGEDSAARGMLNNAVTLSFVIAGLMALTIALFTRDVLEGSKPAGPLVLAAGLLVCATLGGWLLCKRRRNGKALAQLCFLAILIAIPVGTIFGLLGFSWLSKSDHLLRD